MVKVFSTHPMTDDRIQTAQKNIQNYLKAKPEYVVRSPSKVNQLPAGEVMQPCRNLTTNVELSRARKRVLLCPLSLLTER